MQNEPKLPSACERSFGLIAKNIHRAAQAENQPYRRQSGPSIAPLLSNENEDMQTEVRARLQTFPNNVGELPHSLPTTVRIDKVLATMNRLSNLKLGCPTVHLVHGAKHEANRPLDPKPAATEVTSQAA